LEGRGTMISRRHALLALSLTLASVFAPLSQSAEAATAAELNANGKAALDRLYAKSDRARRYGRDARAILVFPKIVKAGLVVGGQGGEGVLFVRGRPAGYYKIGAASFGLQAGGQSFSYALFLMNDKALTYLRKSDGWAIGSGPSVVVVDKGAAMSTTSTTIAKDVYAFPFGQKGLMAGLGLEGSKITPIRR
jgi:lipid-binding SYLF domain-containing protein